MKNIKISIFGTENFKKSIFSKRILDIFGVESSNYKRISEYQNNYFEDRIVTSEYFLNVFNLPYFENYFFQKNNKKIKSEKELLKDRIYNSNKKIILESDYVILLFNLKDLYKRDFLNFVRFIDKSLKKYSFITFENFSLEDIGFSLKKKNFYYVPLFPILNSEKNLKKFFHEEFEIFDFKKKKLSAEIEDSSFPRKISLSIIGTPNSGKSSLLNYLIGYDRSLVSEIEGTTKEEISSVFSYKNLSLEIFDTEGIIKKTAVQRVSSIENSDIVIMTIDAKFSITKNVLQMIDFTQRYDSSLLILINKIDLLESFEIKDLENSIRSRLKSYSFVPIVKVSIKEKTNIDVFLKKVEEMIKQSEIFLTRKFITEYSKELIKNNQPPSIKGKRLKIYYGLHEKGFVHKLVFFVNDLNCVHFSYKRYILNSVRKVSLIENLPIKIFFKKS